MQDINELKLLIASKLDVEEFLDILGFDMHSLVEVLEDEIVEHFDDLVRACD
jgi:hypothetical protein